MSCGSMRVAVNNDIGIVFDEAIGHGRSVDIHDFTGFLLHGPGTVVAQLCGDLVFAKGQRV